MRFSTRICGSTLGPAGRICTVGMSFAPTKRPSPRMLAIRIGAMPRLPVTPMP
jgi:hypothetical protein